MVINCVGQSYHDKKSSSVSSNPSVPLHEIPQDPRDIDASFGIRLERPAVLKVADAGDKLVALETVRPYLAPETVPLLCVVHLRGVVSVTGAAHFILVLENHIGFLLVVCKSDQDFWHS